MNRFGFMAPRPAEEKKNPAGHEDGRHRHPRSSHRCGQPVHPRGVGQDLSENCQDDEHPCVGMPGPEERPLELGGLDPPAHDPEHERAAVLHGDDREEQDPDGAPRVLRERDGGFHGSAPSQRISNCAATTS